MNDHSLFLGKFLRQGVAIASVAPSSRWLSRTTVREVAWDCARVIVELGAGTGPITRVIAEHARPGCQIVVIERDPDFARLLSERFGTRPGFDVIHGDVSDLPEILDGLGLDRIDHVVSGLPVPSFSKALQRHLFQTLRTRLDREGSFSQITEIPWLYLGLYRRYFEQVRFDFEPRNFPPAGVYHCRGVKELA
jgi:phosphatidylethanolamine/phosphatidyl-N-methylethanolamine N-methyltransferase